MTESKLLEAIREAMNASPDPQGALTTRELTEATGTGTAAMRATLGALKAAGKLELVKVKRAKLNGTTTVDAYRLIS